ncbi:hypothetical protein CNZW441b_a0006 (plasmid) [Campylobacter novaezeelandiae]|nr:hypothetical protein [Campylobacter jejuni]EEA6200454.1 hypothetical protein [Campylobacter jejuni]QWU80804.1 hypothetical protein CNZW441b_a0006 [Campylobacter novaezeelandiae]RTJ63536.1 hypothetical protein C3H59_08625 [Campylobacter jejuni]
MKFKNFIKYLNYKKLRNIEKLYFDLIVMIILSSVSFLFLAFKFLVCKDILIFLQDYFLLFIIFVIALIGLFDTFKGIRRYKSFKPIQA